MSDFPDLEDTDAVVAGVLLAMHSQEPIVGVERIAVRAIIALSRTATLGPHHGAAATARELAKDLAAARVDREHLGPQQIVVTSPDELREVMATAAYVRGLVYGTEEIDERGGYGC